MFRRLIQEELQGGGSLPCDLKLFRGHRIPSLHKDRGITEPTFASQISDDEAALNKIVGVAQAASGRQLHVLQSLVHPRRVMDAVGPNLHH